MVDIGYQTPIGKITTRGVPRVISERNVETVADVYPGKLLKQGTTQWDVAVADGDSPVVGWAGYEHTSVNYRKDNFTTIYTVDDKIAVIRGGKFSIYAWLAPGPQANQGDVVFSWGVGQVVTGEIINGLPSIRVPFSKNASEADTELDIPAGVIVKDCLIEVTAAVGSSWIDVGILSTEAGGDANGFVIHEITTSTGILPHNLVDATEGNLTVGALLKESNLKDATGTPLFYAVMNHHEADGTAESLSYTTSAHAIAGFIWLQVGGTGTRQVGICGDAKSASASAQRMWVEQNIG
jgi:hypothetical protein